MQRMRHIPILILTLALLTGLFPMRGAANPLVGKNCERVTTRPLTDFLKAQGTLNDPPQFFPPVKDYNGWTDGDLETFTTFALIDYAGLANTYLEETMGLSLGTKVRGLVLACELDNYTAQITVALFTTKVLGFAQSREVLGPSGFGASTIFGVKVQDVLDVADAAVGSATLVTTFSIKPDGDLPDLLAVDLPDFLAVINTPLEYAPATLHFASTTFGTCADGKKALLHVHQVAATNADKKWVYSTEKVEIVDIDGGHCPRVE